MEVMHRSPPPRMMSQLPSAPVTQHWVLSLDRLMAALRYDKFFGASSRAKLAKLAKLLFSPQLIPAAPVRSRRSRHSCPRLEDSLPGSVHEGPLDCSKQQGSCLPTPALPKVTSPRSPHCLPGHLAPSAYWHLEVSLNRLSQTLPCTSCARDRVVAFTHSGVRHALLCRHVHEAGCQSAHRNLQRTGSHPLSPQAAVDAGTAHPCKLQLQIAATHEATLSASIRGKLVGRLRKLMSDAASISTTTRLSSSRSYCPSAWHMIPR